VHLLTTLGDTFIVLLTVARRVYRWLYRVVTELDRRLFNGGKRPRDGSCLVNLLNAKRLCDDSRPFAFVCHYNMNHFVNRRGRFFFASVEMVVPRAL